MKFVALVVAGLLSTQVVAQTAAIANRHLEASLQYAANGKKAEAAAEWRSAFASFEVGLDVGSNDLQEYLRSDCVALVRKQVDLDQKLYATTSEFLAIVKSYAASSSGSNTIPGDKLGPLADRNRRLDGESLFNELAIVHKRCGGDGFVASIVVRINEGIALTGINLHYNDNGFLK